MTSLWRAPLLFSIALAACGSDDDDGGGNPAPFDPDADYAPAVSAGDLSAEVSNPLFPLPPGAAWVYQATTPDGLEEINVMVEAETYEVWGVQARVVRDTVTVDGEIAEDTFDWYAQDGDGNVWYLGEDTTEYEDGAPVSTEGSWASGVDGALPGVVMLAEPEVGMTYRQEYLAGEAEDYAEVMSLDETVEVGDQTYTGCLETNDRSAIEDLDEFKYYCPGVGTVLVEEPDATEELIEYSGL